MNFVVDYTKEDIYRAQKLNFFSSKIRYLFLFYAIMPILLLLFSKMNIFNLIFWVIFSAFFLSYPYTLLKYSAYRFKNKYPGTQTEISFEIDDNGIRTNSNLVKNEIKWDIFERSRNNENVLLLYTNSRVFITIPRRVMNHDDWEKLLELVRNKIAKNK